MAGHIRKGNDPSTSRSLSVESLEDRVLLSGAALLGHGRWADASAAIPTYEEPVRPVAVRNLSDFERPPRAERAGVGFEAEYFVLVIRVYVLIPEVTVTVPAPSSFQRTSAAGTETSPTPPAVEYRPAPARPTAPAESTFVVRQPEAARAEVGHQAEAGKAALEGLVAASRIVRQADGVVEGVTPSASSLQLPSATALVAVTPPAGPAPGAGLSRGAASFARGPALADGPREAPAPPGDAPPLSESHPSAGSETSDGAGSAALLPRVVTALQDSLPFDAVRLKQGVDDFFARLGSLGEEANGFSGSPLLAAWLVVVTAAAFEFARRRERKATPRLVLGTDGLSGPLPFLTEDE